MAYLDDAELSERMKPDLVNRSTEAQRDDAREVASSVIDSYLSAGGYTVPVSSPPNIILKLTADIARYEVAKYTGLLGQIPKESIYYRDYQDAINFLMAVQKGNAQIEGLEVADTTTGGPSKPLVKSNDSRGW